MLRIHRSVVLLKLKLNYAESGKLKNCVLCKSYVVNRLNKFISESIIFKNWDTFYVAKPFGRISIDYGEPIYFDKYLILAFNTFS